MNILSFSGLHYIEIMSIDNTCIIHYSNLGEDNYKDFSSITWEKVQYCKNLYVSASLDEETDIIAKNSNVFDCNFEEIGRRGCFGYHRGCYSKFTHARLQTRASHDIEKKSEMEVRFGFCFHFVATFSC